MEIDERAFFKKHGDIKKRQDLFPSLRFKRRSGSATTSGEDGGEGGMRVNETYPIPPFRGGYFDNPVEPSIDEQWVQAYSQKASIYGRGVRDLATPFYGSFGDHNYAPIGSPYSKEATRRELPWNYSQPWNGPGPHPIWPVPPTASESFSYNPHAIDWMRRRMDKSDPVQPIGAGDRAAKPAVPLNDPNVDAYIAKFGPSRTFAPGAPFTDTPPAGGEGEAESFRFRKRRSREEPEGGEAANPRDIAPSVTYHPDDPSQTLYINSSSPVSMFPFDQTDNLASAPYTGFPSQWSWSPYPYGPAGEMPGTSGNPEPHPNWFWLRGEIPRTYPGYSEGRGWYHHGGSFHPHLPQRSMMERISNWPGNVGLMNSEEKSYSPGIIAMRAAALRPPTTGSDMNDASSTYTVGGDLQGMRDHYNAVPVEPIPPPGHVTSNAGPSPS